MTVSGQPTISVSVPVYNGASTLETCLASIEAAVRALPEGERASIEVVVCDNHSTDASAEVITAHAFSCPSRTVRPPVHLENRTENWRYALDAGTAPWMAMLHADDGLVPATLRTWLDAVASPATRDVAVITGRHHTFTDSLDALDPESPIFPAPALVSGHQAARWSIPLICPFMPFALMRRTAYDDVGGLDPHFQLTQDWELWWKLCRHSDFLYIPVAVGAWRQHPTGAGYQRRNMTEHIELLQRMEHDAPLPAPVRTLAERNLSARVAVTLADDRSEEADAIRARTAQLPGSSVARWLRAGRLGAAVTMNALRVVGALRYRKVTG